MHMTRLASLLAATAMALALLAVGSTLAVAAPAGPAVRGAPTPAPWIGLRIQGLEVVDVVVPSPAAVAGLEAGDRLVAIDGEPLRDASSVVAAIARSDIGRMSVVRVARGDRELSLAVFVATRPEVVAPSPPYRDWHEEGDGDPSPGFEGGFEDDDLDYGEDEDSYRVEPPRAPPSPPPAARASAPDVAPIDLASLRGRPVVVAFIASWCTACRYAIPTLARWRRDFGPLGLEVVAVSDEDPRAVAQLEVALRGAVPLAWDPRERLSRSLQVRSLPTVVVLDAGGREVRRIVGAGPALDRLESTLRALVRDAGDR